MFRKFQTIYIIMELCTGGELFDKLYDQPSEKFSEPDARSLMIRMLRALSYLHANGIVHRDLKLENFIFSDKSASAEIKLIDFGFSRQYLERSESMTRLVGTCYYLAPEVLEQHYTEASDLWSLGVVAYMMLTGLVPFGGNDNDAIQRTIRQKTRNPAALKVEISNGLAQHGLSENCIQFMLGLLTVDPEARLTAKKALETAWILNGPSRDSLATLSKKPRRIASTAVSNTTQNAGLVKNLRKFKDQMQVWPIE